MAGESDTPDFMNQHFENAGLEVETTNETAIESATEEQDSSQNDTQSLDVTNSEGDNADGTSEQGNKEAEGKAADTSAVKQPNEELKPGDIRGEDGKIIRAGAERRHYETARLAKDQRDTAVRERDAATKERDDVKQRLTQYEDAAKVYNGLQPAQLANAARLYQDVTRDPVGTLKSLVAEAKKLGHNVAAITGQSIDNQVISDLSRQVQELQTQRNSRTQQQDTDSNTAAAAEVEAFYGQYPDARQHDAVLGEIVRNNPKLSNVEAYFLLREECIKNDYDFNKPLEPQFRARQTQQTQQQSNPTPQQSKPMLNGRTSGLDNLVVDKKTTDPFNSDVTDDIVKAAMREAGLEI